MRMGTRHRYPRDGSLRCGESDRACKQRVVCVRLAEQADLERDGVGRELDSDGVLLWSRRTVDRDISDWKCGQSRAGDGGFRAVADSVFRIEADGTDLVNGSADGVRAGPAGIVGKYYPYGEARGTVPQDAVGFATYTNDSATGLEYADQRYYASNFGRFMSPDPYKASAGPKDPKSWNRYSYTRGDPVNRYDPAGLDDCDPDDPDDPCEPPPPDPCGPTSDGLLGDDDGAASSPCDPGPVRPPDDLPPPCSIALYSRATPNQFPIGGHSYLIIWDPEANIYDLLEGVPTSLLN